MRLLLWPIKVAFFTALVLVLGQVIRVRGRTVSDEVKVQMAKTQSAVLRVWKP